MTAAGASFLMYGCSEKKAQQADQTKLPFALKEATEVGNTVVNARDLTARKGLFTFVNGNESQLLNGGEQDELKRNVSTCVVFVHGYNTHFAASIANGNELWKMVKLSIGDDASSGIRFFTFCWHGDLGPLYFTEANESAVKTAPILGEFLRRIANAPRFGPCYKLIVVTHSLGALVALEALHGIQDTAGMPLVDTLLMIQPAVAIEEFGRGQVEQVYRPPARVVEQSGLEFVDLGSCYNDGKYFETVTKATTQTFATASIADGVLGHAFDFWDKGLWGYRVHTYPTNRIALGAVWDYQRKGWAFPSNLKVLPLSPREHLPARIRAHGDLFDPKNISLIRYLTDQVRRQQSK
jgi:pimeloyl-ACP methyl ester carboxylesterase